MNPGLWIFFAVGFTVISVLTVVALSFVTFALGEWLRERRERVPFPCARVVRIPDTFARPRDTLPASWAELPERPLLKHPTGCPWRFVDNQTTIDVRRPLPLTRLRATKR